MPKKGEEVLANDRKEVADAAPPSFLQRLTSTLTAPEVAGGALLAVSLLLHTVGNSYARSADAVSALSIRPIADVAYDVDTSGRRPLYAAVEGRVASNAPLRGDAVVIEKSTTRLEHIAKAKKVASRNTRRVLPNDAAAGGGGAKKDVQVTLEVQRVHEGTTTRSTHWVLDDGSSIVGEVLPSCGSLPLGDAATTVTALPAATPSVSRGGEATATAAPFAVEVVERFLKLGSLLTVVGHATVSSDGVLRLGAGPLGPSLVSTKPLHAIVRGYVSTAAGTRTASKVVAVVGLLCVGWGLWKKLSA